MKIVVLNPTDHSELVGKQVELVKFNDKYYIELEGFENSDCIVELSIALTQENEALKERIYLLERWLNLRKEEAIVPESSCYWF